MDISEIEKQTIYQHNISTILGEPAAKLSKPVPNTTKIIGIAIEYNKKPLTSLFLNIITQNIVIKKN